MLEKLAKQSAIYGISTIVGRLLSYLLTPYYTRVFSQESFGIITDVYAIIPFALVLLTMGMESSYFRYAAKAEAQGGSEVEIKARKKELFGTTWGITSLAALLFTAIAILFNREASAMMGDIYVDNHQYVMVVAGIILFDVVSAVPFARLREQNQAKKYVALKLLNICLQVGLAFGFGAAGLFATEFGVGWALVANLIASVLTFGVMLLSINGLTLKINKIILLSILTYSLPLLLSGLAATATDFIDRQMIKFLVPEGAMAQLGVYGAVVKIAVVMTLFTQMYRLAAEPFFLANYKREQFVEMNAAAMKYFVMASIIIFLTISLFKEFFALIVGPNFREGIYILPIVLGANILTGVWLNLSFWYKREERTSFALIITLTGLVAAVGLNFLLVPTWGYYGAAWARFIGEAIMVIVSYILNRKYFPTPYDLPRICEYVAMGLAVWALSIVASNHITYMPLHYALNCVLLMGAMTYAIWREKIDVKGLINNILRRR